MIKSIETTWNGTKFRSRLEARWAYVFTELRIEWKYEYEGYELPSGRYLPDFFLKTPKVGKREKSWLYVEVKPDNYCEERRDIFRWYDLVMKTNYPLVLLKGIGESAETKWFKIGEDGGIEIYYDRSLWDLIIRLTLITTTFEHAEENLQKVLSDAAKYRFDW